MSHKKQASGKSNQVYITYALDAMNALYGHLPGTELIYHTPFQLLLSVMLSAQTTDKQVNKVTSQFYSYIRTPQDLCQYSQEEVYKLIKGVNYSKTKAKHIWETANRLQTTACNMQLISSQQDVTNPGSMQYGDGSYYIPDTLDELITLPGVGVKTAKVVLAILYNQAYIAVDTHVHRVAHRLGWVKNLSPEKTSKALEKMIPDAYKRLAHRVMIYFGRYLCKSHNPHCVRCPLQQQCTYFSNKK